MATTIKKVTLKSLSKNKDIDPSKGTVVNPFTQEEYNNLNQTGEWTGGYVEAMGDIAPPMMDGMGDGSGSGSKPVIHLYITAGDNVRSQTEKVDGFEEFSVYAEFSWPEGFYDRITKTAQCNDLPKIITTAAKTTDEGTFYYKYELKDYNRSLTSITSDFPAIYPGDLHNKQIIGFKTISYKRTKYNMAGIFVDVDNNGEAQLEFRIDVSDKITWRDQYHNIYESFYYPSKIKKL